MKLACSFLVLMICSYAGLSQPGVELTVETGLNCSGFPRVDKRTVRSTDKIIEKNLPIVAPIVGLTGKLTAKNSFFFSSGIQFNKTGEKYRLARDGYDKIRNETYSSLSKIDQSYQRVMFPLVIGYHFRLRKGLGLNPFLGYRIIRYRKGKYYSSHTFTQSGTEQILGQKRIDPFDHANLGRAARERSWQGQAGIEVGIGTTWSLTVSYSSGDQIQFVEKMPPGVWDATGFMHTYSRGDLAIALKYQLLSFPKGKP